MAIILDNLLHALPHIGGRDAARGRGRGQDETPEQVFEALLEDWYAVYPSGPGSVRWLDVEREKWRERWREAGG